MDNDTQATGSDAPVTTDTAVPQPSEASVQTNTDAPEATQTNSVQEEATDNEVKAEDTAEEKLYAGKYKTTEALVKGYKELESMLGRTNSEKAELSRILSEAFAGQNQQVAEEEDSFQDEPQTNDPRIETLERNQAVSMFVMSHPDADGKAVNKILAEDPVISNISGYGAKLEYAYLKSQNMVREKTIVEAQRQSAQATEAKILEKQTAQVESAKKQAQPSSDNEVLSQDELRQRLRDDKSFDDILSKKFPVISSMRSNKN